MFRDFCSFRLKWPKNPLPHKINGKEGFYKKLGFEVIPNGIRKMIEI